MFDRATIRLGIGPHSTVVYNAFIRTTDHCKVQTAFVSLFMVALCNRETILYLWSPCVIGQTIIFSCCFFLQDTGRKKSLKIAISAPSHNFVGLYLRN